MLVNRYVSHIKKPRSRYKLVAAVCVENLIFLAHRYTFFFTVSVCECMCTCPDGAHGGQRRTLVLGAGVTGVCRLPDLGAGIQILLLMTQWQWLPITESSPQLCWSVIVLLCDRQGSSGWGFFYQGSKPTHANSCSWANHPGLHVLRLVSWVAGVRQFLKWQWHSDNSTLLLLNANTWNSSTSNRWEHSPTITPQGCSLGLSKPHTEGSLQYLPGNLIPDQAGRDVCCSKGLHRDGHRQQMWDSSKTTWKRITCQKLT